MKKILAFLVLSVAMFSCYEEYILDYDYDGVYFPYQLDVRTMVVGEGMKVNIGVAMGGVRDNDRDRVVNFQIDNSLINDEILSSMKGAAGYIKNSVSNVSSLQLLPANYYSLSDNSKLVIKKGQHSGVVTLKVDSAKFVTDAATMDANYALPLRITSADADTVLQDKNYAVIGVKYENMLFGNYWHGGVTEVKDPSGNVVETIYYPTTIPAPESKVWVLKTTGPMTLAVNGFSDQTTSKNEFELGLNGGTITIKSLEGATNAVMANGACTFNQAKLLQDRKIFLNYKYVNAAGNTCYATDTLTFRNRIRDGVNEWQDENPSHYN